MIINVGCKMLFIYYEMIIGGETYKRMIINVGCKMLFIYYEMILGCGYLYVGWW